MKVRTLVELYDERPLENVLGVEIFHPEQVIYVCPAGTTPRDAKRQLKQYFLRRGIQSPLRFLHVNVFDTRAVLRLFRKILSQFPDSVLDITGGTDAVLFAAGLPVHKRSLCSMASGTVSYSSAVPVSAAFFLAVIRSRINGIRLMMMRISVITPMISEEIALIVGLTRLLMV